MGEISAREQIAERSTPIGVEPAATAMLIREDVAEGRANLVIKDMPPNDDENAMFAMMLDKGVSPSLMSSIVLGLYKPGTGQIAA